MKHTVLKIDSYYNAYGREVIDYTTIKGIQYSVEKQYGKIRGFVKVNGSWNELNEEEAIQEYDYICKVIHYEVQKEKEKVYNYEKTRGEKKKLQNIIA